MLPSLSMLPFVFVGGTALTSVTVPDLCRGLSDMRAAIQSFEVTFRKGITMRPFNAPAELVSLHEEATVVADSRGRGRYEARRSSVRYGAGGKNTVYEEVVLGTFDGKLTKSMNGVGKYTRGAISEGIGELPWQMNPWNFLTHYFSEPVDQMLGKRGGEITGEGEWQGRRVLVVQRHAVPDPHDTGCKWKYRFLIDLQKNFLVVERAGLVQYAPDLDWVVYTRIRGFDHVQAAPGIWVPMRIEHESFDPTKESVRKGVPPPLSWRWNINVTKWTVNQPLADSVFDLRFQPGVFVNDRVLGRSYHVAAITDQMLADQASGLRGSLARWFSWRGLLGWGALAALIIVVAVGLARARRRFVGR